MVGVPNSFLNSADGGDDKTNSSDIVGVQYIPPTRTRPPLRIFYPAAAAAAVTTTTSRHQSPVGWFQDTGVVEYLKGYAHVALMRHDRWASRLVLHPVLYLLALVLPMTWLRIPGVYQDATPITPVVVADDSKQEQGQGQGQGRLPVVVFSHGLTGTGQENAVLCAAWAKQGMVVVAVHHTDGSSACVRLADGTLKYYDHPGQGPADTTTKTATYDATFRPRQIKQRSNELLQAYEYICSSSSSSSSSAPMDDEEEESYPVDPKLKALVDPRRAVAAGYSYGAATVAHAIIVHGKNNKSQHQPPFQAALFLDGWFHIDMSESAGVAFPFPQEAFDHSSVQEGHGLPIPSLFLNSEQFQGFTKLFAVTERLAGKDDGAAPTTDNPTHRPTTTSPHELVVLPETGHQNFCDVVFWFRPTIARKLMLGMMGPVDPIDAYQEIIERSSAFLRKQ